MIDTTKTTEGVQSDRILQLQNRIARLSSNKLHNANPIHHAEQEIIDIQTSIESKRTMEQSLKNKQVKSEDIFGQYKFRIKHILGGKEQMTSLVDNEEDKEYIIAHLEDVEKVGIIRIEKLCKGDYITKLEITL